MRNPVLLALTITGLLAGCGGTVAPNAPGLLPRDQIDLAIARGSDTMGGVQASSDLALRAARLRDRSAALQRTSLSDAERRRLLQRAEELKAQQR